VKRVFGVLALSILLTNYCSQASTETKINLLPHQKAPVNYLLKHPEQKGLLLFHSMGSGKTFIALDYAEKNQDRDVVLLVPEFLQSNWISQMKKFGVRDSKRYRIISLDHSESLLSMDLTNTIVIVDEIHKLIYGIRSADNKVSEHFIEIYEKLRTSDKLIALTGTPVFSDTSDISYIANLFSSQDQFPIDPVKFRTEYMEIKPVVSLVRGHLTESKLMVGVFPFVISMLGLVTLGTSLPWAVPFAALGGGVFIPVTNELFPINQVSFRKFNVEKWKDFSSQYISYYQVKLAENEDFPKKEVIERRVTYSDPQVKFFINFVDENLSHDELRLLLSEYGESHTDSYIRHHSAKLQRALLAMPGSGREIGNLDFVDSQGTLSEAPKFKEILREIQSAPGQVAVYSNYDRNGVQKFAGFLDRHGMKDQYLVLSPKLSVEQQIDVINCFNEAKKRILIIHPEISEGINLVGTEQFHILEPVINGAQLNQIIGRAIRFKSHEHLPKGRRLVKVMLWESSVEYSKGFSPTSAGLIRHENWQEKFSEVNPSTWTKGITELDQNFFLKDETPDDRVKRRKSLMEADDESFRDLLQQFSVEKSIDSK
jgi:hypothetical protein